MTRPSGTTDLTGTTGELSGRVALVTGGSGGIGAAVCVALARAGAAVAVNGTDGERTAATVRRVTDLGGRALAVVGSVADAGDVERMLRITVEELGGLHIAVNNAGLQTASPFLDLTLEGWRAQLSVDLDGAFLVARGAAAHMVAHGGGVVVNVTSVHEHQPRPGYAAYCVAKAGLGMLTQVMARELTGRGVRTVSVAPGAVATAVQGGLSVSDQQAQLDGIPAGRLAQPEEVAELIAWVCSPRAAYVSGASLVVDGALMTQVSLA